MGMASDGFETIKRELVTVAETCHLPYCPRVKLQGSLDLNPIAIHRLFQVKNGKEHRHEEEHIGIGQLLAWTRSDTQ